MSRFEYLTDDLNELDAAEHDLEENGIPREHIHILSNDTALQTRDLPSYSEWERRDVFHSGMKGAMTGALLCLFLIIAAAIYGATDPIAWGILTVVSAIIFGFCIWEGGLIGMNKINHRLQKFDHAIQNGEHLLVIDTKDQREDDVVMYSIGSHPMLRSVD